MLGQGNAGLARKGARPSTMPYTAVHHIAFVARLGQQQNMSCDN